MGSFLKLVQSIKVHFNMQRRKQRNNSITQQTEFIKTEHRAAEQPLIGYAGDPTDSDPGYEVTEDFETAYARAVAEYERDLRLRRIQIGLRLGLLLFIVAVLGITAKIVLLIVASTSTATAPMTSTLRTTSATTPSTKTTSTTTTSTTTTSSTLTTTLNTASTTTSFQQDWGQVVVGGGGWNDDTVELFPPPPSDTCSIPNLTQSRYIHTLSLLSGGRLVVCGGHEDSRLPDKHDSCISWVAGNTSWTHLYDMSLARNGHTAWTPPSLPDSIVLLGGRDNQDSDELPAETVPGGGTFALEHPGSGACGIPNEDTIVMIGGYDHAYVTRYNINGFVEELPQLPESRYQHSCAALPTTGAFIVAGGWGEGDQYSSVVTFLPGAADWTSLTSLPRKLRCAPASIVGGRLRVTGGHVVGGSARSEVLEYHPEPTNTSIGAMHQKGNPWTEWVTVGNLLTERFCHAVLTIGPQQLPCLS